MVNSRKVLIEVGEEHVAVVGHREQHVVVVVANSEHDALTYHTGCYVRSSHAHLGASLPDQAPPVPEVLDAGGRPCLCVSYLAT